MREPGDTRPNPFLDRVRSVSFGARCFPTRKPETNQSITREARWEQDIPAYKRLHKQGYRPRTVDGSRLRELKAENEYDIEHRPVTIDYNNVTK